MAAVEAHSHASSSAREQPHALNAWPSISSPSNSANGAGPSDGTEPDSVKDLNRKTCEPAHQLQQQHILRTHLTTPPDDIQEAQVCIIGHVRLSITPPVK